MRIVLTICVAVLLATLGSTRADDEKTDKDGYVPLFGTPTWFIHKGKQNTWGVSDDGTSTLR